MASASIIPVFFQSGGKYFEWRVALDAELFAMTNSYPDSDSEFDGAMAMCLGVATQPDRSMESRWRGARRLLLCQIVSFALQAVCLLGLCALLLLAVILLAA